MNKIDGLHHLAICTADMKAQIAFLYRQAWHGAGRAVLDAWR